MNRLNRPFEALKLIRDGVVTNIRDFGHAAVFSREYWFFDDLIEGLNKIGFINYSPEEGDIEPTPLLGHFSRALKISLTQLKAYTESSLVCTPIFGLPSAPKVRTDIFVVMPFLDELRDVFDKPIKNVANELNLSVVRADDFFTTNSIISDIWDAINASKVVVADCTGRNPNVFYEIGIAHTLGKPVILIAQNTEDIPFDVQHVRAIIYEFTPGGVQSFEKTLKATIETELTVPESLEGVIKSKDK